MTKYTYRLVYAGSQPDELVVAEGAVEAVNARTTTTLPIAVCDDELAREWHLARPYRRQPTPLLDRMYGPEEGRYAIKGTATRP